MEARSGRSVLVAGFSACLFVAALSVTPGCGNIGNGEAMPVADKALPTFEGLYDTQAHRFFDMYEEEDLDIGSPPE